MIKLKIEESGVITFSNDYRNLFNSNLQFNPVSVLPVNNCIYLYLKICYL